jgi:hypothetical protein
MTQPGEPRCRRSAEINITSPQPARRYDYWLGGKDNYAVDRRSADELKQAFPAIELAARENRRFVRRVVRYLAADLGIRQFLDIGVGMPAPPNVHEIAQAVDPSARVIYVDNDPVVAVHARALLAETARSVFVSGDLRRPQTIVDSAEYRRAFRPHEPVALLLGAVLHFIEDDEVAYSSVRHLRQALPPGSAVALSHVSFDPLPETDADRLTGLSEPGAGHGPFRARTRAQIGRFLDGLEPVEPGLVSIVDWHPDREPPAEATAAQAISFGAVARVALA